MSRPTGQRGRPLRSGSVAVQAPNFRRRRIATAAAALVIILGLVVGPSLGGALTNQALGTTLGARFAEWSRTHGGNGLVNWVENVWYSHHQPRVGGLPPVGALRVKSKVAHGASSTVDHLPAPVAITPIATPALPGEGRWTPVGRAVDGQTAIYETRMRPDAVHTSVVVGVAWMDTNLLRAALYSGSFIPGGGPFLRSAPVSSAAAGSLVAGFNAGFQMPAANGGYYADGRTVLPLRSGAASVVIRRDGSITVGQWGRDASMTPDIVSVRQNLDLLVDNG